MNQSYFFKLFICLLSGQIPLSVIASLWTAGPELIYAEAQGPVETVAGMVFEDLNGDGRWQSGEPGIGGVKVSNGIEVVLTDEGGRYKLPVLEDMNLTVVQPSGWQVPTDHRRVPQFFYVHKPSGSPATFRFGGLPKTGPMPERIHFPLRRSGQQSQFKAAVIGDSQTYSNTEVGYLRDSMLTDLLSLEEPVDLMLYLGDVVGDDLGLLDRVLELGATVGVPQWLVHGNHDLDFDATSDADSSDSWRRIYGPQYYAFEVGEVLFVVLDNVVYPCGPEDMQIQGREFCGEGQKTYNGRIPGTQMQWLANLLALTPKDRLVVFAHHIPFVSLVDTLSTQHQTDNVLDLYSLASGHQALSLSGHTHTLENHSQGQAFLGWEEAVGVKSLPFRHIVAGAASGSWYHGDFSIRGVPMSLQRCGSPKGSLLLDFQGTGYRERYLGDGLGLDSGMWVSLNTPAFRAWFDTLSEFSKKPAAERAASLPPVSINDLPDIRLLTPEDLEAGVWLTANVWAGSAETTVEVSINGGEAIALRRTQQGVGEAVRIGAEWADPFAAQRQLAVARYAIASESGVERNQGMEAFKGRRFGPAAPQPMGRLADRNMHLWHWQLPVNLPPGVYHAAVQSTDRNGQQFTAHQVFEVRSRLPAPRWNHEPWE